MFEIASMEVGRTAWALLVRFRRRTHTSTALLPVAPGLNLVTEAVERGLCAEGVSDETLELLPEVLRRGPRPSSQL